MTASASRSVGRAVSSAVPGRYAFHEYPSIPPEVVACLDRPRPKYSSVATAGPQAERRIEEHQHDRGDQDPNGDVPRPRTHQTKQATFGRHPPKVHVVAAGNQVNERDGRREGEGQQEDAADGVPPGL